MQKILLSLSCLLLLGCSDSDSSISAQISNQFKGSKTAPIDLSVVSSKSWDHVCILPPYTTNEMAEKILGFQWDAESKTNIALSDSVNVLVFIADKKVINYTEHPRSQGDFSELKPPCLPRQKAVLQRKIVSDGSVYLVAE